MYTDPAISINDQIQRFINNGLFIEDRQNLEGVLNRISYFRLKEYGRPFQNSSSQYVNAATENHILDLYIFDHFLRIYVFEAIKVVEVALRTKVANLFASKYGPIGYIEPTNFGAPHKKHTEILSPLIDEIKHKKEKNKSIQNHYSQHKDYYLPVWMAFEFVSFGIVTRFYDILKSQDKKIISKSFGLNSIDLFSSWIHSINYTRNACAHHSRLWNTELRVSPERIRKDTSGYFSTSLKPDKVFYSLTILLYLLKKIDSPIFERYKSNIRNLLIDSDIKNQLNGFETPMGIASGWENTFPWKINQ